MHDRTAAGPRSAGDSATVELREVTKDDVRAICRLAVAPGQMSFVAPNAVSFAEALFEPIAWFRGVYADGIPVGFAMLSIDRAAPEYYLWRLMIDARYQGRGYGRSAMALIIDFVRTLPRATELVVSWVPADGGPEPFYRGLGFVPTGEMDGIEVMARLRSERAGPAAGADAQAQPRLATVKYEPRSWYRWREADHPHLRARVRIRYRNRAVRGDYRCPLSATLPSTNPHALPCTCRNGSGLVARAYHASGSYLGGFAGPECEPP